MAFPDLVNGALSDDASRFLLATTLVDDDVSKLVVLNLRDPELPVVREREVNGVVSKVWSHQSAVQTMQKLGPGWDAPTEVAELSWEDLQPKKTATTTEAFFPSLCVPSPDGRSLGVSLYKGGKFGLMDSETLNTIAQGQLPNFCAVNSLNFSDDGSRLAVLTLDQGGGHFTLVKQEGESLVGESFTAAQLHDDYMCTGSVLFEGEDLIVSTCAAAAFLRIARYSPTGEVVWDVEISDEGQLSQAEFFGNLVWNNTHRVFSQGGKLFVGGNDHVHTIDLATGALGPRIEAKKGRFLHQLFAIPGQQKLVAVSVLGSVEILNF